MPQNFTAVSEQAKRFLLKGRVDKAMEAWNAFLPDAGDNDAANALNNLGDLCLKRKDNVAAIDHYIKASEMFERAGFPLKAIATLKKVLKNEPERAEVHLRLAELNARRDMIGNAVEAYLTVVRLMTQRGQRDEAMNLLKHICILDPVNIRHRLALAAELFALGYQDEAMAETVSAIDLFVENGNLEEAERYCRHLTGIDADYEAARERLERIATAGRDGVKASGLPVGESSIDDLFAELDGLLPGDPIGEKTNDDRAVTPEPVPADSDAFSLDGLLEPTGHSADATDAPDPLLGLGNDLDAALAGLDGATESAMTAGEVRDEAFRLLGEGDLAAALPLFGRYVDDRLEAGDPMDADATLRAYLAADPDNPAAHEMRLRIYQGTDPEMEEEILDRLASLWSEQDPIHAERYRERLERLRGGDTDDRHAGGDAMDLDLREVMLDNADAERPEWAGADDHEDDGTPVFNFDLDGADESAGLFLVVDEAVQQVTGTHEIDLSATDAEEPASDGAETAPDLEIDHADTAATDVHADADDAWHITLESADAEAPDLEIDRADTAATDVRADADDAWHITLESADTEAPELEADAATWTLETADDEPTEAAGTEHPEPTGAVADLRAFQQAYADAVTDQDDLDLREALAEATFYQHQNLTDEAIAVYRRILAHHPGHEQAIEQLAELGVEVEAPTADAEPERPITVAWEAAKEPEAVAIEEPEAPVQAAPVQAAPEPETSAAEPKAPSAPIAVPHVPSGHKAVMQVRDEGGEDSEEFLDLAAEIRDVFEDTATTAWNEVSEQSQLGDILSAFRAGIREQVGEGDSETHYDLGVAYREMGLTEEAVAEFQIAIKGVERYADACIALAECFSDMGRDHLALGHLRKALAKPDLGQDQWMALAYELATALERSGEPKEAKQLYEQVYAQDVGFRDVAERLSALG